VKPDTIKVTKPVNDIGKFISGNIGKNITISFPSLSTNNQPRQIKGTVLNYFEATQMVKVRTADGRTVMGSVENALEVYNDGANVDSYQQDSLVRMAKVKLDSRAENVDISTVSLQTGMSWVPSYFLKLNDDKTARLELKATIGNGSEEPVTNASVDLVIGNPQLFYGTKLDDIATDYLQTRLLDYNRYENNNVTLNTASYLNSVTQNFNGNQTKQELEEVLPEMANYDAEGEKSNDLFYFSLGNLSIESRSKTIVPLTTTEINYKDVYELEVGDQNSYYTTRRVNVNSNVEIPTWHLLKIENTGKAPFTTGPIFVVDQKDRPLAQDEMKYTSRGTSAKIRLSKAIDVVTKNTETIVNNNVGKKYIDEHTYTIVLIKGKIEVRNYQSKPIKIDITKNLTGNIVNANGGEVSSVINDDSYFNLHNSVKWAKEIPANGKIEVEYQYEVMVL